MLPWKIFKIGFGLSERYQVMSDNYRFGFELDNPLEAELLQAMLNLLSRAGKRFKFIESHPSIPVI